MNEIAETLVEGLLEREAETGATITWAGAQYPCSGGGDARSKTLDIGGFKLNASVQISVRTAVFPGGVAWPGKKQKILYSSAEGVPAVGLRIDDVTALFGAILVLQCNDPNAPA